MCFSDLEPIPTHNSFTFMELVKIKEAITKLVEKTNKDGKYWHEGGWRGMGSHAHASCSYTLVTCADENTH